MSAVKNSLTLAVALITSVSISSCTWVRQATGEKEPLGLSPSGLGAATGAVVGSGVGAIIGSQSGNAGIGLAIGAASGAAFGGALGQQEDRETNSKEERNVRSARQDELLKANQNRIDEYKKGTDISRERRGALATPKNFNKSSFVNTPPGYRGNPRAVSFAQLDTLQEFSTSKVVAPRNTLVARVESPTPNRVKVVPTKIDIQPTKVVPVAKVVSKTSQVDLIPEEVPAVKSEPAKVLPVVVEQKLPKANSLEPTIHEADESMKTEISKATATNGVVGIPVQANKEIIEPGTEEIKTTVITGSKVGKSGSDDDCTRADQEYQRATTSISDADKLFYLRRALRLCAAKPNLHLATGRVYSKLGRVEDAEYEFRQVLDLEPSNSEASKELASLKQGLK
jgi:hypothetical protein